jgi:putative ABC transport system permease protein
VLGVTQVTLSLVLLISSGVAINSLIRIWQFDWGFVSGKTLVVDVTVPPGTGTVNINKASYFEDLVQRLRLLPGVKSVAVADRLPIGFSSNYAKFTIPDQPAPPDMNSIPSAAIRMVNSGYFETFAVHLMVGRKFEAAECFQQKKVALINETLAKRYWPGKTPIGRDIEIHGKTFAVVGIASDRSSHNPMERPPSEIILPYTVDCPSTLSVAIEGEGNLPGLVDSVRKVVKGSGLDTPIFSIQTLEQKHSDFLIIPEFVVGMLSTFACIALLLAAVGVYGLLSFFVSQKTREIGIRMALGAHSRDVILMVFKQGLTLFVSGAGLGFLGGYALTRILTSQVYWLKANLPLTCLIMLIFLLLTAILACVIPVRRAVRVSPVEALRFE